MVSKEDILGELPSNRSAYNTMFQMAWPCALEAILVSTIASIDTMMVGTLGPAAIAAVGITSQPKMIVLAVILSLNVGVTAVISRRKGQNDPDAANATLKHSLILSLVLSLIMAVFGGVFGREILSFAGAGDDYIDTATQYLQIIMVGNVFQSMALTINAAQRGVGNTKISMKTNVLANIVNLIFNYLLINGIWIFPQLGTQGAAIATVLGNIAAFILSVFSICVRGRFLYLFDGEKFQFNKMILSAINKVSSNAMLEQVFIRVGFFLNTIFIANLGTTALATYQISANVLSICFSIGDGISMASASLSGQSLGAKRSDLSIIYGKVGQRVAEFIGLTLLVLLTLFRREIITLFTDEIQIIHMGATLMIITGIIGPIMASNSVFVGVLRGAGDVKYTAKVSLISITFLRPTTTYLLSYTLGLGVFGAYLSILVDQIVRYLLLSSRFYSKKWTKISL